MLAQLPDHTQTHDTRMSLSEISDEEWHRYCTDKTHATGAKWDSSLEERYYVQQPLLTGNNTLPTWNRYYDSLLVWVT
jgi:hypothetical protein